MGCLLKIKYPIEGEFFLPDGTYQYGFYNVRLSRYFTKQNCNNRYISKSKENSKIITYGFIPIYGIVDFRLIFFLTIIIIIINAVC